MLIFHKVQPVRNELFWDRFEDKLTPEIEIERAINFGSFDYIKEVQGKYGMEKFVHVLMTRRNLRKVAVNYWCLVLGLDREKTAAFKNPSVIWSPYR